MRMMNCMKRITVSLPDDIVEEAREMVEAGEVASVSAYVAEAMRSFHYRPTLKELLEDMDREFGPVSPEVAAEADKLMEELFGPPPEEDPDDAGLQGGGQ